MNKKKMVKMGASLALVGIVGVGATLAYLQTDVRQLDNAFTLGQGYPETNAIVLDEKFIASETNPTNTNITPVNNDPSRTTFGNDYNVNVGTTVEKDPRVSLSKDSPNSYVFVGIKGEDVLGEKVETEVNTSGDYYWNKVFGVEDSEVDGIYVYSDIRSDEPTNRAMKIDPSQATGDFYTLSTKLFESVVIENMNNTEANTLREKMEENHIKVYAVAVQADDVEYSVAKDEAVAKLKQVMGYN